VVAVLATAALVTASGLRVGGGGEWATQAAASVSRWLPWAEPEPRDADADDSDAEAAVAQMLAPDEEDDPEGPTPFQQGPQLEAAGAALPANATSGSNRTAALDDGEDDEVARAMATPRAAAPSLPRTSRVPYNALAENDRYLCYSPSGGWTNQMIELASALLFARSSNRSLVVPMAAEHTSGWQHYDALRLDALFPADRILDFEHLERFFEEPWPAPAPRGHTATATRAPTRQSRSRRADETSVDRVRLVALDMPIE